MAENNEALLTVAKAHLMRFAFFTRDNAFVSAKAEQDLEKQLEISLLAMLDGRLAAAEWLSSPQGLKSLEQIRIACLPRDLQLTGQRTIAVTSVHGFLDAPVFWWLVSVLWCMTVGRRLDALVSEDVRGFRLHADFLVEPANSGVMFRSPTSSYGSWKRQIRDAARERPGEVLAANTIDLEAFYYSIAEPPSRLESHLRAAGPSQHEQDVTERTLSALLDALHLRYAGQSEVRAVRAIDADERSLIPLPVGLPSSQILANVVIDRAIADLKRHTRTVGAAAYADDIVLLTDVLPQPAEPIGDYLDRLGVFNSDSRLMNAPSAQRLAVLRLNLEKCGTTYSKSLPSPEEGNPEDALEHTREVGALDPYLESEGNADWGGPLRTVLRAPHRRERNPRSAEREVEDLVGDIAAGLDAGAVDQRLFAMLERLDAALLLRLRRFWPDLAVAAASVRGGDGISVLTKDIGAAVDAVMVPEELAGIHGSLLKGLWESWAAAAAQALAVALGEDQRRAFADQRPRLETTAQTADFDTAALVARADEIRRRSLVPPQFVAVPLAEYSAWTGPLLGAGVMNEFVAWVGSAPQVLDVLQQRLGRSARFVHLHEACLAVHLWAGGSESRWLDEAFDLLRRPPLTRLEDLASLEEAAKAALTASPDLGEVGDDKLEAGRRIKVALPSVEVEARQLEALLNGDDALHGNLVKQSRDRTRIVVNTAAKRKADLVVLPEWAVLAEQLTWVMNQARRRDFLLVAGQAPAIEGDTYFNRLWTGIPLRDAAQRRACLVPPPRVKRHLSPHEAKPLADAGVSVAPGTDIQTFWWRGLGVASLICFEFADIGSRQSVRRTADVLTVSSFNRDWRYFEAIQDSTTRDNYCLTCCVNASQFPGTRLTRPTKNDAAVVASVHGADYPTVLLRDVDLNPLSAARATGRQPDASWLQEPSDDAQLDWYKPLPPDWNPTRA